MRLSLATATVATSVLLLAGVALAQSSPSASGHWEGAIEVPGQPLAISVELSTTAGGAWDGAISIPAQHISAFPLSDITVKDAEVSFAMKGVPGDPTFTGKVAGDPRTMTGQMTQGGMSMRAVARVTLGSDHQRARKSLPISRGRGKELVPLARTSFGSS